MPVGSTQDLKGLGLTVPTAIGQQFAQCLSWVIFDRACGLYLPFDAGFPELVRDGLAKRNPPLLIRRTALMPALTRKRPKRCIAAK